MDASPGIPPGATDAELKLRALSGPDGNFWTFAGSWFVLSLVVNAAECEPFITVDNRECIENSWDVLSGIQLIKEILDIPRVVIAVRNVAVRREAASSFPAAADEPTETETDETGAPDEGGAETEPETKGSEKDGTDEN